MLNAGFKQLQCPDCKEWTVYTKDSTTILCKCTKVVRMDVLRNQEILLTRKVKACVAAVDASREELRKCLEEILTEKVRLENERSNERVAANGG
jgi:hypothetical protein